MRYRWLDSLGRPLERRVSLYCSRNSGARARSVHVVVQNEYCCDLISNMEESIVKHLPDRFTNEIHFAGEKSSIDRVTVRSSFATEEEAKEWLVTFSSNADVS